MPCYDINVKFVGGKVYVDINPFRGVGNKLAPDDEVTWKFDSKIELQVLFPKYRELPDGFLEPCSSLGPFKTISSEPGKIVGIVRDLSGDKTVRFIYNLLYKGEALVWVNPVPNEAILAGGIDIPMTPEEQPTTS